MSVKYYQSFVLAICFIINSLGIAQTILDSTTVIIPESNTLNKCIDENDKVTYTQFECEEHATRVDDNWIKNTTVTFAAPIPTNKSLIVNKKNSVFPFTEQFINNSTENPFDALNSDKSGIQMLQDSMKDKSLLDLFDQGIKAIIMRKEIMDSL